MKKALLTIALTIVRAAALLAGLWCIAPLEETYPVRGMFAVAFFIAFGAIRAPWIDASGRDG